MQAKSYEDQDLKPCLCVFRTLHSFQSFSLYGAFVLEVIAKEQVWGLCTPCMPTPPHLGKKN